MTHGIHRRIPSTLAALFAAAPFAFSTPQDEPFAGSDDDSSPLLPTSLVLGSDAARRADSHAPIGVMGDHVHSAGEWMVSLRWTSMPAIPATKNWSVPSYATATPSFTWPVSRTTRASS